MLVRRQIATGDARLPMVERPRVPTAITSADVKRNEACMPMCTAAAAMLRSISVFDGSEVLEGALGQAFAGLDQMDWDSNVLLLCPLGFGVLLWSGLLKATADVSFCFAHQAQLSRWESLQCGPNMRRVFGAVLD